MKTRFASFPIHFHTKRAKRVLVMLPALCLERIAGFVDRKTLRAIGRTCKRVRAILKKSAEWRHWTVANVTSLCVYGRAVAVCASAVVLKHCDSLNYEYVPVNSGDNGNGARIWIEWPVSLFYMDECISPNGKWFAAMHKDVATLRIRVIRLDQSKHEAVEYTATTAAMCHRLFAISDTGTVMYANGRAIEVMFDPPGLTVHHWPSSFICRLLHTEGEHIAQTLPNLIMVWQAHANTISMYLEKRATTRKTTGLLHMKPVNFSGELLVVVPRDESPRRLEVFDPATQSKEVIPLDRGVHEVLHYDAVTGCLLYRAMSLQLRRRFLK